LSKNDNKN